MIKQTSIKGNDVLSLVIILGLFIAFPGVMLILVVLAIVAKMVYAGFKTVFNLFKGQSK
jgi:hypothetical protein